MNSELSGPSLILVLLLILVLAFWLIPGIFNTIKKLWYLDKNSGYSSGMNVRNGMYYDAKNGKIEADQRPLH